MTTTERRLPQFNLHLRGPALVWFNSLSETAQRQWSSVAILFQEKFINFTSHSTVAVMEGLIFNTLQLILGQTIDDFHSQILENGNLLQKPNHELLAKFIDGLPKK